MDKRTFLITLSNIHTYENIICTYIPMFQKKTEVASSWNRRPSNLVKVAIHDLGHSVKECSFTCARKHRILCFLDNLLNHGFLLQGFSTHHSSNGKGGKPSLYPLFQKHGWDVERASTLKWQFPSMELQKGNVFFSIQRHYVVNGLCGVRLTSLWPIEPFKCAIFELHGQQKCKSK